MPQSLVALRVHIVFSTKNRGHFIQPEIESELYAYLAGTLKNLDSPAIKIGGTEDHIHILCSQSKNISLVDVIGKLKSHSSGWMKTKGVPSFYWQKGYGAFSIGKSGESQLVRYIANQKAHHRKKTFQDEFREILKKYDVPYDERYVWD